MDDLTPQDLFGSKRHFAPIKAWLDSWGYGTPSVYPFILVGDSGVGKSTAARAYAHDAGYDIIESHADAERDVKYFNRLFGEARMPSFFGKKRCLIVEDAGAISNSAWRAFEATIKEKAFPLIIISQSENDVAWRYRKSGITHRIPQPAQNDLLALLNSISPAPDERMIWISQNSTSWRQAMMLLKSTPPDWMDDEIESDGKARTGFAEVQRLLRGEHPHGHGLSSHPLGVIQAAEWNCAPPENVCEALRLHSLAWMVDGLSAVSIAYLKTLRANTQDKTPFRKRDISGSTRRI